MLDRFADLLRLGPRTRARLPAETFGQSGLRIDKFTSRDLLTLVDGDSTLIVHDRHDSFTPFADAVDMSRRWPGSTLVPTVELGHQRLLYSRPWSGSWCSGRRRAQQRRDLRRLWSVRG